MVENQILNTSILYDMEFPDEEVTQQITNVISQLMCAPATLVEINSNYSIALLVCIRTLKPTDIFKNWKLNHTRVIHIDVKPHRDGVYAESGRTSQSQPPWEIFLT